MSYKRLYRSVTNRRVAGVAGGIAEYFNIDPTPIRLLWLLAIFFGGTGLLAYLIAWIAIPEAPLSETNQDPTIINVTPSQSSTQSTSPDVPRRGAAYIGIFLILLGGFFLLRQFLPWEFWRFSWAFILIALGIILLIPRRREP